MGNFFAWNFAHLFAIHVQTYLLRFIYISSGVNSTSTTLGHWKWHHSKAFVPFSIWNFIAMIVSFTIMWDIQRQRITWRWKLGWGCPRSRRSIDHIIQLAIGRPLWHHFRVSSYLAVNNILTLKFELEITQGHWNWYHSKASVRFPICLP